MRRSDQLAITMDLSAMGRSAAGVSMSPHTSVDGIDLLPQLSGVAEGVERTLYWRMRDPVQRAIRRGKWKYLRIDGKAFLYDLDYDPRERSDFAEKNPELLAELKSDWEAWSANMLPMPTEAPQVRLIDLASTRW